MVASRCAVLLRGADLYHQFKHILPENVIMEVTQFIFDSPSLNTERLKKAKGVVSQAFFCMSEKGHVCQWSSSSTFVGRGMELSGYKYVPASDPSCGPDTVYYAANAPAIKEDVDRLVDLGLDATANLYVHLINAPINERTLSQAALMQFIESFGFLRTRVAPTVLASFQGAPPITNPSMAPYVKANAKKFMDWTITNNRLPSNSKFLADVIGYLTPKSAGVGSIDIEFMLDGEPHSMKLGDKISVFLSDPERYLAREAVLSLYTFESPARLGFRWVPARNVRAISVSKLPQLLSESIVTPELMRYQSEDPSGEWPPLGSSRDFRVGADVGIWAIDHAAGLYTTSHATHVGEYADYSGWDISVRKENCFTPYHEGINESLNQHGITEKYGLGEGS